MKIAVLGAGAIGSVFGGLLAESGQDVTLVDIWQAHVEAINQSGLRFEDAHGVRTISVRATTDPSAVGPVDLVILFVKAYQTRDALKWAFPLFDVKTSVLTMQNGLGNREEIESVLGPGRTLLGVTSFGGTMRGPGHVFHGGSGDTVFGEPDGSITPRLRAMTEAFAQAGLPTGVSDNLSSLIWGKLLINCAINPVSALMRVKNGVLLQVPECVELMKGLARETAAVAAAQSIQLPYPDPEVKVLATCSAVANNITSMQQDILARRRTEVDFINGAVVRTALTYDIPSHLNAQMVQMIKALEGCQERGNGS